MCKHETIDSHTKIQSHEPEKRNRRTNVLMNIGNDFFRERNTEINDDRARLRIVIETGRNNTLTI